jgi:HK97 family phage major capsid protein
MALVKSGYLRNAEIYATNNTIWTQLANIVDNTGKPMFIPDVTNGTVGKLFGIRYMKRMALPMAKYSWPMYKTAMQLMSMKM